MNNVKTNNLTEKIITNQEILSENNLIISDVFCTNFDKLNLLGYITTKQININKPVIVGAYQIKNNEIIQVSATAFHFKKLETRFLLTFDNLTFDKIYLYAEILNNHKKI